MRIKENKMLWEERIRKPKGIIRIPENKKAS